MQYALAKLNPKSSNKMGTHFFRTIFEKGTTKNDNLTDV